MSNKKKKEIQLIEETYRPLETPHFIHDFVMIRIPVTYDFFDDDFRRRMNDAWNSEQILPRIPAFTEVNAFIESIKKICPLVSMMRGVHKKETYIVVNIAQREANKGSRMKELNDLIVSYNN